jgi:hypothetical protein
MENFSKEETDIAYNALLMYYDSHLQFALLRREEFSALIPYITSKINICLQTLLECGLPIRIQKYSSKMYGTIERDGDGILYRGEDEEGFEKLLYVENGSLFEKLCLPPDFA